MRFALLVPLLLGLALTIGCRQAKPIPTQDIVTTIPWGDEEKLEYLLFNRGNDEHETGRGTISVQRMDGQFELTLDFSGEDGSDVSTVVVDAETLKPVSLHRVRVIDNDTQTLDAEYDAAAGQVNITAKSGDSERTVPTRLKENSYDNDSSLFIWRTIPFADGYKAAYRTVVTGSASSQIVELKINGTQEVTVPAGTFQAWRLEVHSPDRDQIAWFADTPQHPLVKYDNSIQVFELVALPESPAAATPTP